MELDSEKYHRFKEVSPWRVFFLLVLVNFFLFCLVLLFPNNERWIGNLFKLQFVSTTDLFTAPNRVVVDLDSMLGGMNLDDTTNFDKDIFAEADSAIKTPELNKQIQYPNSTKSSLTNFFEALLALENGSDDVYRILHYGDSQLEGDRVSDYLRNKFQLRFGGAGPGVVLPIDVSRSRISILQSESKDWQKFAIYGNNRHPKGLYGIGASSYVYTGTVSVRVGTDTIIRRAYDSMMTITVQKKVVVKDTHSGQTVKKDSIQFTQKLVPYDSSKYHYDTIYKGIYQTKSTAKSWLKFNCAKQSYPLVRSFNRVEIMFSASDTCVVDANVDGKISRRLILPTAGVQKMLLFQGNVTGEVLLQFIGPSPTLYGVFLDGDRGLAIDNFPMRGSSGTGFEIINQSLYTSQLKQSKSKLIIMQYGINVVPNPISNYDYYERLFYNQLVAIKKADPDANILVIGPSDMSRKFGGEYVSYPNITKIRDAMRNAAFKSDCAFWDLYAAMGGQNSMVSWALNEPALASKDFTHFNARGARFVGEMLYDAIMSEYLAWKKLNTEAKAN